MDCHAWRSHARNDGNTSHTETFCHTECSEVSLNLKTQIEIFRAHALNMTKKFSSLRAVWIL
ncbi:hypothetical protein [Helicobacter sp. T3_23-1056]